uniref:Uncharacterized protein n=1 Tax=viral metagenome TaxID=1070528 RepID=A0A6C0KH77_9ZZZZ
MLLWIIIQIIVSLSLIILVHKLYEYFKESLTDPLEKDYMNESKQKYEEMYNILKNKEDTNSKIVKEKEPKKEKKEPAHSMKDELNDYIKHI